jgi:hypothetical protein
VARRDKASALCRYAVIVAGNILSWTSPPPFCLCRGSPKSRQSDGECLDRCGGQVPDGIRLRPGNGRRCAGHSWMANQALLNPQAKLPDKKIMLFRRLYRKT